MEIFYTSILKNELNVPELLPLIKDVADDSEMIYYDDKTKDLSIYATYLGELRVSEFVKYKLFRSHKLNIDWTQYKNH